jgi:hypothetical protein
VAAVLWCALWRRHSAPPCIAAPLPRSLSSPSHRRTAHAAHTAPHHHAGADSKWASWRAWVWAASCVLSRTMYHPDDPPCGCLTPLADLHNYAPPAAPFTPDVARDMQALLAGMPAAGGHGQQQRATQEQAPNRRVPTPACAATDAAGGHAATAADGKHSGTDAAADAAASPPEPAASQQQQTGSTQQCSSNGSSGDGFFDAHGGVYTIVARRR